MNEYDEIAEKLRELQRTDDPEQRVDLGDEICKRIVSYPESHPLVLTYYSLTGTRTEPGFDPKRLE